MNEIKLGGIETPTGKQDTQGYRVYSIFGTSLAITNDSGGLGHNKGGLFLVVRKIDDK